MWQRKLEFQTWYYISNPKKSNGFPKKSDSIHNRWHHVTGFSQRKETFFVNFRLTK